MHYKSLGMQHIIYGFAIGLVAACGQQSAQTPAGTQPVTLRSGKAMLTLDAWGGAITGFQLQGDSVNPFSWALTSADMPPNNQAGAPFKGHFLCLGRWGAPTAGEMAAGVPHNGQAGNGYWLVDSTTQPGKLLLKATATLDGIVAERLFSWVGNSGTVWQATETVQSTLTVARPYNIVQHATIGAPFLDTATRIYSNAADGFLQALCYPSPAKYAYQWPIAHLDTTLRTADLRSSATAESYVSTHVFTDSLGWIAAVNPATGLCLGYVWRTADYPWLNLWHQVKDGKPWAKGLEFGTTGVGKSYQELLAADTRFKGQASYFFLDAGEKISKSYYCFLTRLPANVRSIDAIGITANHFELLDKSTGSTYQISLQ